MTHPASESDESLLADCELTFLRRSGPGGQHRNKTETAVVVLHRPTGLRGEASERRSQADNRRMAIFRLRLALATHYRAAIAADGPLSHLWNDRVKQQRLAISADHVDFPGLLAEAMDCLHACGYQLDQAAGRLLVTRSQTVKLLRKHRPAFEIVNRERQERGLGILQ